MTNITFLPTSCNIFFIAAIVGVIIWWCVYSIKISKKNKQIFQRLYSWKREFLHVILLSFNLALYLNLLLPHFWDLFFVTWMFCILAVCALVIPLMHCEGKIKIYMIMLMEHGAVIIGFFLLFLSYTFNDYDNISFIGTKGSSLLNPLIAAVIAYFAYKLAPETDKAILPVVYKTNEEFEILPKLILERKDEVWGVAVLPNVILRTNRKDKFSWFAAKAIALESKLNGKQGDLPSDKFLFAMWNKELRSKIQTMVELFYDNGIDVIKKESQIVWCSNTYMEAGRSFKFNLTSDYGSICDTNTEYSNCIIIRF